MCNVKAEVEAFDSLDNCAAWPFENYMLQLKKKSRRKQSCSPVCKKGTFYGNEYHSRSRKSFVKSQITCITQVGENTVRWSSLSMGIKGHFFLECTILQSTHLLILVTLALLVMHNLQSKDTQSKGLKLMNKWQGVWNFPSYHPNKIVIIPLQQNYKL